MNIMLIGSSGMLGQSILSCGWAKQHRWVGVARRKTVHPAQLEVQSLLVDLNHPQSLAYWEEHLKNVDVVINCVGIIRETSHQQFEPLHYASPKAIFMAAERCGVHHIIQVSALGAEKEPSRLFSQYHKTKQAADQVLQQLTVPYTILYPSVILSPAGQSTQLFMAMASLPVTGVPNVNAALQPVAIDDVMATIEKLLAHVEHHKPCPAQLVLVGNAAVSMRILLSMFKTALGLPKWFIPVPLILNRCVAELGEYCSWIPLNREMLAMLQAGNASTDRSMTEWLARNPIELSQAVNKVSQPGSLAMERIVYSYLYWGLAAMWMWTACVSIGNYAESQQWMSKLNVPVTWQNWLYPVAIYGGGVLDLLIGIGIVLRTRGVWWGALGVMVVYSVIISVCDPAMWIDPLNAASKNIPLAAMTWAALLLNRRAS